MPDCNSTACTLSIRFNLSLINFRIYAFFIVLFEHNELPADKNIEIIIWREKGKITNE